MTKSSWFTITHTDDISRGRTGIIHTPHGDIETPYFFPVGTKANVKTLEPQDLREIGVMGVLANTYHLHLRPGEDVIQEFGGLASFMSWNGPTMTDSGGFQVFSLGVAMEEGVGKLLKDNAGERKQTRMNKISEEGVTFQSHLDGSTHTLTPESSISIQEKIGADLIVGFDDLESPTYDYQKTLESLELTERWLLRSKSAHQRTDQFLYGVTHGGKFEDLRIRSAEFVNENFDAVALGGAHESKENMYDVIEWTTSHVDENKPRHLLGIGEIDDIFAGVERGIDTFDCVVPTRMGRMGCVFVHRPEGKQERAYRIDLTKAEYAHSSEPIDNACDCRMCKAYSRGYIHSLFRAHELLGYKITSYHNVYFLTKLMQSIRESIKTNSFHELKTSWIANP